MRVRDSLQMDAWLLAIVSILLVIGMVTIYSSSGVMAMEKWGSSSYFLRRQVLWILIGGIAAWGTAQVQVESWRKLVVPLFFFCVVALVLTLLVGTTVGGARRWLRFAGIGFQPSEFVKFFAVLFIANYADKHKSRMHDFVRGPLPALLIIGLLCGMILLEPDLGTPVMILSLSLLLLYLGGARGKHLGLLVGVGVPLVLALIWFEPYRRRRFFAFLHPWENSLGDSYQLVQSFLALGSGGLAGVGLGNAHSKLLYLPEPHTDFIFPILGEEFGWVGSVFVIGLYLLLMWVGFRIASRMKNLYRHLLALGITLWISIQSILNIAVVTGCMPTKGMPLPFISFGGSSLVVSLAAIGILWKLSREQTIS